MESINPLDNDYYKSYEDLDVHELMLNDAPRVNAYKQAIDDNKNKISGKVVLDVGAGTGILSVFCAQAGAAKVYAVEASEIYRIAENIVKENNYEHIIEVIHSTVEEVDLPEKVDVIISEFMGFYLFHESMLESVIMARDKFLKIGGLMFPVSAALYAAPCSLPSMYDYWSDIEGVKMNHFAEKLRLKASEKPITLSIESKQVLTDSELVVWLNLNEVTVNDIANIKVQHVVVSKKSGKYQGLCLWFSCMFPSEFDRPVFLSTEPGGPVTHWKQTIIVLPNEIDIVEKHAIAYELSLIKTNNRRYNIEFTMLDPDEVRHPTSCTCMKTRCILSRAMMEKCNENGMY